MTNSVPPAFDRALVAGVARGTVDAFDYIDALPGLVPHPVPSRIPRGAPILMRGWAVRGRPGVALRGLTAVVDNAREHPLSAVIPRPDLAAAYGSEAARGAGYRFVIPTEELQPGAHGVRIYANFDDGLWYEVAHQPFTIFEPVVTSPAATHAARLVVESVIAHRADNTVRWMDRAVPVGDTARIVGWALDTRTGRAPGFVRASAPDGRSWSAPCAIVRQDARDAFDLPSTAIGFTIIVPAIELGLGLHTLEVTAYDEHGGQLRGGEPVTIDVGARERAFPEYALQDTWSAARAAVRASAGAPHAKPEDEAEDHGEGRVWASLDGETACSVPHNALLYVDGWALAPGETAGAERVYLEFSTPGSDAPPQRWPAVAGSATAAHSQTLPRAPLTGAAFAAVVDTRLWARGVYRVALLAFAEGAMTYARRPLGVFTLDTTLLAPGESRPLT
jgi:hypothetical protein